MTNKVKAILFGLGAMGSRIGKVALAKKGLEIVGALEVAKDKVGKDLGEVLRIGKRIGVIISDDPDELFSRVKGDIVIHSTVSYLRDVYLQISVCIKAGMNVVSTCEELSYPYSKYPELANEIDRLAKKHGVTVLGTGINPGYLMDTLPIVLTGMCQQVKRIKVTRMMYSGNRRASYQKKIGTGMTLEEFGSMIKEGKITGHVGLEESISMISATLGWKLDQIEVQPPEPVLSDVEVETWTDLTRQTPFMVVKKGYVCGLKNLAYGIKRGERVIELQFTSHANIKEPYDEVIIKGVPDVHEKIVGGVNGDIGTVSMIINAIPQVINAKTGLVTMKELPPPSCKTEDIRKYLR